MKEKKTISDKKRAQRDKHRSLISKGWRKQYEHKNHTKVSFKEAQQRKHTRLLDGAWFHLRHLDQAQGDHLRKFGHTTAELMAVGQVEYFDPTTNDELRELVEAAEERLNAFSGTTRTQLFARCTLVDNLSKVHDLIDAGLNDEAVKMYRGLAAKARKQTPFLPPCPTRIETINMNDPAVRLGQTKPLFRRGY